MQYIIRTAGRRTVVDAANVTDALARGVAKFYGGGVWNPDSGTHIVRVGEPRNGLTHAIFHHDGCNRQATIEIFNA